MKILLSCITFLCFAPMSLQSQEIDLEYLRLNYEKAVSDKQLCSMMIEELEGKMDSSVFIAYLGGLQTIWANHTLNPISKFQTFKTGKGNLERAVEMAPNNIETRFIRLSVQKNAPRFLGYHQQIEADEEFINRNKHSVTSASLLQMINK